MLEDKTNWLLVIIHPWPLTKDWKFPRSGRGCKDWLIGGRSITAHGSSHEPSEYKANTLMPLQEKENQGLCQLRQWAWCQSIYFLLPVKLHLTQQHWHPWGSPWAPVQRHKCFVSGQKPMPGPLCVTTQFVIVVWHQDEQNPFDTRTSKTPSNQGRVLGFL